MHRVVELFSNATRYISISRASRCLTEMPISGRSFEFCYCTYCNNTEYRQHKGFIEINWHIFNGGIVSKMPERGRRHASLRFKRLVPVPMSMIGPGLRKVPFCLFKSPVALRRHSPRKYTHNGCKHLHKATGILPSAATRMNVTPDFFVFITQITTRVSTQWLILF